MSQAINTTSTTILKKFPLFTKILVGLTAFMIPIGVGYWRYSTQYGPGDWKDFVNGMILALPFSLGLALSTVPIGRRMRWLTLSLILVSAIPHLGFAGYYGIAVFITVATAELYAIFALFRTDL